MIELWNNFVEFCTKLLYSIFAFFKDMLFWVLDNLFTLSLKMLDLVALSLEGLNPLQYINAIPESTKGMMSLVGFNESMAIIITAISIRFILQLIPFVRWGS